MSALTIPNVPPEMLALLSDRAAISGRTVEEELLSAADQTLRAEKEHRPICCTGIPAPFDLELEGRWERVAVRDGGPLRLEFWFDEDKRFGMGTGSCEFERPVSGPAVQVPVGGERLPALPIIPDQT